MTMATIKAESRQAAAIKILEQYGVDASACIMTLADEYRCMSHYNVYFDDVENPYRYDLTVGVFEGLDGGYDITIMTRSDIDKMLQDEGQHIETKAA